MNKINTIKYIAALLLTLSLTLQAQSKYLFCNDKLMETLSESYVDNEYVKNIIEIADKYLSKDVNTITTVVSPMGKEHLHDYFSEGPYWWPDPENPDGAYIREDGKRNPDRFSDHKELMMGMYQSLSSLAIATHFTGEKKYAAKIEKIINDWFINPETMMAPNLKYAQMIRNKDVIRGVGIIETHRFVGLIESMILLKESGLISNDTITGFDKWLNDYYTWLTKSQWGIDEKYRGNNHSSWWAAQSVAIAVYLGLDDDLFEFYEYGKSYLIDRQIDENCRQPLEEERTLSLSYNTFNLNALSFLSAALLNKNYNLFKYRNENESSILCAAKYINQFIANPDNWKLKQIKQYRVQPKEYTALIGLKLNNKEFLNLHKELLKNARSHSANVYIDPFVLLLDAQVSITN